MYLILYIILQRIYEWGGKMTEGKGKIIDGQKMIPLDEMLAFLDNIILAAVESKAVLEHEWEYEDMDDMEKEKCN